jgi:uncharacterized membrane protein YhdT
MNRVKPGFRWIFGLAIMYLAIGCVVAWHVDPVTRGGVLSTIGFIVLWPMIFFAPS